MFQLREINQMEHEMCQYLDWELNVEPSTLKEFEEMVCKDLAGPGPYPTYVLQTISKLAATSMNPFPAVAASLPTPLLLRFHLSALVMRPLPSRLLLCQYLGSPLQPNITSPTTSDTPPPCHSDTTSPASSASPPTPAGLIDDNVKTVSQDTSPVLSIANQAASEFAALAICHLTTFSI